jgi:hypothetical protein
MNGVQGPEELYSSPSEIVTYKGVLDEGHEVWCGLFSIVHEERDEN